MYLNQTGCTFFTFLPLVHSKPVSSVNDDSVLGGERIGRETLHVPFANLRRFREELGEGEVRGARNAELANLVRNNS